jgi:dedicator of cytokinesis protein 3
MRFFRTNFQDEIQRLPADSNSVLDEDVSARGQGGSSRGGYDTGVIGVGDWSEQHMRANSISNGSTTQQVPTTLVGQASFMIPPLAFGQVPSSGVAAPPPTPGGSHFLPDGGRNQTPLQRNLARLTRYGMSSITSGPGDRAGIPDRTLANEIDTSSQQGSMINVGAGMVPASSRVSVQATARDVASTLSAAKSRISRMGSFSWRNKG